MNGPEAVVQALQALSRSGTARTKAARLRELLPEIDAAQAAGVRHAHILDALNAHGFALSMKSYSVMLWRLRQGQAKKLPPPDAPPPAGQNPMAVVAAKGTGAADSTPLSGQAATRPGEPQRFDWETLKNTPPEW